jgi:hypothetical protein
MEHNETLLLLSVQRRLMVNTGLWKWGDEDLMGAVTSIRDYSTLGFVGSQLGDFTSDTSASLCK